MKVGKNDLCTAIREGLEPRREGIAEPRHGLTSNGSSGRCASQSPSGAAARLSICNPWHCTAAVAHLGNTRFQQHHALDGVLAFDGQRFEFKLHHTLVRVEI